jgi:single-strand DNA-binding protein
MLNQVFMMGNLTGDPELKYLPSGSAVCSFSLALNSKYKAESGMKEEVSYVQTTAFGKTAENCAEYLAKGSKVLVQGRLKQERWEKDGKKHSVLKVMANLVNFLDGKPRGGGKGRGHQDEEVY